MTIILSLAYNGSSFIGWQTQKKDPQQYPTVQHVLAHALERVYGTAVKITAASRTDSGVHAKAQTISFTPPQHIPAENLLRAINTFLPHSVRVMHVHYSETPFNARRDACSKVYIYRIYNHSIRSPFDTLCYWIPYPLNVAAMRHAAQKFVGEKDFKPFTTTQNADRATTTTLYRMKVVQRGHWIYIAVHGRNFLHKMMRFIVGALIEVGRGAWDVRIIDETFSSGTRAHFLKVAPPEGLFLKRVRYEETRSST